MPVSFTSSPTTLVFLAIIGALCASFLYWAHRNTITDMGPARRWTALFIRFVIIVLLLVALSGIRWVKSNDKLTVVFLLDASKSIRDDQRDRELQFARDAIKSRRPTDQGAVVTYGVDPDLKVPPGSPFSITSVNHRGATNATDIAQAMEFGLSLVPKSTAGKFVILSDFNENVGSALAAVPSLTARGIRADTLLLPGSLIKESLIEKLVLPNRVKIGEPFTVQVITRALNPQTTRLSLRTDANKEVQSRTVDLPAGKRVHSFMTHIDKPGFYRFEALLETNAGEDTIAENNKGLGFISVKGRPRVLYIAPNSTLVPYLRTALQPQNIDVEHRLPSETPTSAAAFQQYDTVILSDVARADLSISQMTAMQVSTRDFGVGFGMVGGEHSFGAGGYRNSPIEETLPVSLEIKKQKRLPSVAVALVIEDLEMPSLVNMSKEASKALIDLLDPMDEVGVLDMSGYGFAGSAGGQWRVKMQHVVDRAAIQRQIDNLDNCGDPPSYTPYLMEAAQRLAQSEAKIKHIIFLGDGDAIYEGEQNGNGAAMRKIRNMGITVSTVATAADKAGVGHMQSIAQEGGGHSYVADKPEDLPRILLKDQQTISAPPIIEEPFLPVQTQGDDVLSGLGSMPQLLGYNIGTPKPTAGVSLVSHRNDPILSTWRYGLGRSMAFTSDDKNKWAVHWLPWAGYGTFWAQAIRWTMRSFSPSDYQTEVTTEGTRGHVLVRAIDKDGKFVNRLNFKARVVSPDTDGSKPAPEIPLRQTGPGTYEAWFDAAKIGTYLVNVTREIAGKAPESTVAGLVVPYSPEFKDLSANDFLATQLAQVSGGEAETSPNQAFGGNRPVAHSTVDLTPSLLLIAMLLFPFDVAVRRLALNREDFLRVRNRLRRLIGKKALDIPNARKPDEPMSRLQEARKRAHTRKEDAPSDSEAQVQPRPLRQASKPTSTTLRTDAPAPQTPEPTLEPTPSEATIDEADGFSRLMAAKQRARDQREQQTKDREDNTGDSPKNA